MVVLPQVVTALVILGVAFGAAALPVLRHPNHGRQPPLPPIVPRPNEPGSMLSFAALPSFLILLTLCRLGLFVAVADAVNTPESTRRLFGAPQDVEVDLADDARDGTDRLRYPRQTGDLTADTARRVDSTDRRQRIQAVHDLAWWTAVCPNYAPFTVPRLGRVLRDPDPAVKGAAAFA